MTVTSEGSRTVGVRLLPGTSDLAALFSLDFDERLFRRNYRWPVLVSAALAADADDLDRWLTAGAATLLGRDLAARTLNRIASEAAEPLYLQAIVSGGSPRTQEEIRIGIAEACLEADCTFLSGAESSTWDRKVTIAAVAAGVVERVKMMSCRQFALGDVVLALASPRLWPPLAERARELLAAPAVPKAGDAPGDAAATHVQPAPVLAGRLQTVLSHYTVKRVIHAMTPVESDGLEAALRRVIGPEVAVKRSRMRRPLADLLATLQARGLIVDGADEAHARGIGFLVVVSEPFAAAVARRLQRLGAPAAVFGHLVAPGQDD